MVFTSYNATYKSNSVSKFAINIIIKNVSKSSEMSYKILQDWKKHPQFINNLRLLAYKNWAVTLYMWK